MRRSRNGCTQTLSPATSAADDMQPGWRFSTAAGGFKGASSLAVAVSVVRAPNSPEMGDRDAVETMAVGRDMADQRSQRSTKIASPASSMPRF